MSQFDETLMARFSQLAAYYTSKKEGFRASAYKKAVSSIQGLISQGRSVKDFYPDALKQIAGIGDGMVEKIKQSVSTGTFQKYEELKPFLTVPTPDPVARIPRAKAEEIIAPVKLQLESEGYHVEIAGSYRRNKPDVKDIDLLVVSALDDPKPANILVLYGDVIEHGNRRAAVTRQGLRIDLRVVPLESFGAAMMHMTGDAEFNKSMRGWVKRIGFKLNEYGLFKRDTNERVAGETEDSIFQALGLEFIPPDKRSGYMFV